ncbi:MAG: glycosyltransferase [Deltaproteobacteria bacterium]|nr:glycosyltransferase [Deltaproteobacteria bacterium]
MKGRILHIISGDLWGGAEAQVLYQAQAMKEAGWEVTALLFNRGAVFKKYQEAGLKVYALEESLGFLNLLNSAQILISQLYPQVVVAHGYKENILVTLLKLRNKFKLIVTFHGATEPHRGLAKLKIHSYQICHKLCAYLAADRVIVVSKTLAGQLGLANWDKTQVIYNIINASHSNPASDFLITKHPAIIMLGRLSQVKRLDLAIEAIAVLKEKLAGLHLYIVGQGELAEALNKKVVSCGLDQRVTFLGFRDDIHSLLSASDLYLLTSDSEGLPTALLEALSHAKPIVATDVGGVKEAIELFPDYPAILVNPGDAQALSAAIDSILTATPVYDSAKALQIIKTNFSLQSAVRKWELVYSQLLKQ